MCGVYLYVCVERDVPWRGIYRCQILFFTPWRRSLAETRDFRFVFCFNFCFQNGTDTDVLLGEILKREKNIARPSYPPAARHTHTVTEKSLTLALPPVYPVSEMGRKIGNFPILRKDKHCFFFAFCKCDLPFIAVTEWFGLICMCVLAQYAAECSR